MMDPVFTLYYTGFVWIAAGLRLEKGETMSWFERVFNMKRSLYKRRGLYDLPEEARITERKKRAHAGMDEIKLSLGPPSLSLEDGPILGLRVEVTTRAGMEEGVPSLLRTLEGTDAKGTFYMALGPDRWGRTVGHALRRPSVLRKGMRSGAHRVYGPATFLSGLLLPAKAVATGGDPRAIVEAGHETGVMPWNHRAWEIGLPSWPYEAMTGAVARAEEAYNGLLGAPPKTFSSPGWLCSDDSLRYLEKWHFDYSSDCRGSEPFLPVIDGRALRTPQVPTTLPTLDETLGKGSTAPEFFAGVIRSSVETPWQVLTIRAEWEGGPYRESFASFLSGAKKEGVRVVPLRELLSIRLAQGDDLPRCTMAYGLVEGLPGVVSIQLFEV